MGNLCSNTPCERESCTRGPAKMNRRSAYACGQVQIQAQGFAANGRIDQIGHMARGIRRIRGTSPCHVCQASITPSSATNLVVPICILLVAA
jgi:hypothetical protein